MARAHGPMRRHWSASPKKRQLKSRLKVRQNPRKTMSIVLGNPMLLNQRNDIRRGRILADAELITKEQVLDFEPARRLEEADGEHCERMQEREHRARSCADSTRRCESQAGSDFGNDSKNSTKEQGQVIQIEGVGAGCSAQRFPLRALLVFLGEALREAAAFWTAKSSSFAPPLSLSRSQTGWAPRPAHVLPDLSRYLTATFRPFNELPRTLVLEPTSRPNLESWSCSSLALPLRAFSTSSRSAKSASTDIEPRFVLAIFHLPRNGQHNSVRQQQTG